MSWAADIAVARMGLMTLGLEQVNKGFEGRIATEILKWTYDNFDADRIRMSTSFGPKGIVLLRMFVSMGLKPRIFTSETGCTFEETCYVWYETLRRYQVEIEAFSPEPEALWGLLQDRAQTCLTRV